MMSKIVQCVPNISEGRNKDIIEHIIEPLKDQKGFKLISVEPDADYHRSVITLIGDPEMMIEPLVRFFERALTSIDMRKHQGEHPRMGAVDVVPFIPIEGVSMDEAIQYAHQLATAVSTQLHLPIFMYAEAATHPDRIKLPMIRKGEFEGMRDKLKDPRWRPDYGDTFHETFGVTAIGARSPLIAYNIDLSTDQEKVATRIARAIRGSGGGYQYIQAGPALLEDKGFVQVTMNILDYKKNPMYRIFETVRFEAKSDQVDIISSEVIGLIPKSALLQSIAYYEACLGHQTDMDMSFKKMTELAIKYLKLRDFDASKIIEYHL